MGRDSRFLNIGKAAWALASWEDVVQETIVEVMKEFFYKHNKPAKAGEVYDYVRKKRPVGEKSVSAYLHFHKDFVRVGVGVYQLSSWPVPDGFEGVATAATETWWTKPRVAELVVRIFDRCGVEAMPMSSLVEEVQREMKALTTGGIYIRLQKCPALRLSVLTEHPRRLEARVIRNYKIEQPVTLRERFEATVREILRKQPEQSMTLAKLKEKVIKRGNVRPYTFYQYLSDMIDIQKNELPGSRTIMVTLVASDEIESDVKDVWDRRFTYDVAISYAGLERKYASSLAEKLRESNLKVFYDRHQLPDLIGRNLLDELLKVYRDKAKLCVILASKAYNSSPYAQYERQSAQDRALKDPGYIVLVRLEDTLIEGFQSTIAFLEWDQYELEGIAAHTIQQLKKRQKK